MIFFQPSSLLTAERTIQTYGTQGVAKKGTTKCHHSIIYASRDEPAAAAEEAPNPETREFGMLTAIRVNSAKPTDIMDPMARLNYIKMYTVEHNVKVYNFGKVHDDFLETMKHQWNWVWQQGEETVENNDEISSDDDDDEDEYAEEAERRRKKEKERRKGSSKGKEKKSSGGLFGKAPRKRR